jgi:hypothetical protein
MVAVSCIEAGTLECCLYSGVQPLHAQQHQMLSLQQNMNAGAAGNAFCQRSCCCGAFQCVAHAHCVLWSWLSECMHGVLLSSMHTRVATFAASSIRNFYTIAFLLQVE